MLDTRLFVDWLKLPIDLTDLTPKKRADFKKKLETISIAGFKNK